MVSFPAKSTKLLFFIVFLTPALALLGQALGGRLGANPVEVMTHETGEWGLRFLLLTLAVTPARRLTGWNGLQRYRRMLGLFAFFYVCLHFSIYLVFDHWFDLRAILEDIVERPYITVGFAAFVLLIPLALTSTRGMIRRLGRRWQPLHRLVYVIAVLAVLHFLWLVKADLLEPLVYAVLLALLLGYRVWRRRFTKPAGVNAL